MIKTFWELISTDHQMTIQLMEEEIETNRETIRKILVEDLWKTEDLH
jgi:hypothetical protein